MSLLLQSLLIIHKWYRFYFQWWNRCHQV